MARFKKGDTVRLNVVGTVGLRSNNGVVDVTLPRPGMRPHEWNRTQEVYIYEGDLIRAKHDRSFLGCQACVREDIKRWSEQPGRLQGGLYGVTITSKDDCPSGHGDACEDDTSEKPKRKDPDDMDEPEDSG